MNDSLFYVVHAYIHASEQYEVVGIFSKKEDVDGFIESYDEPDYTCTQRLSMNDIKTMLVKDRLLSLSDVLESLINEMVKTKL
jgi:hypothetical protein